MTAGCLQLHLQTVQLLQTRECTRILESIREKLAFRPRMATSSHGLNGAPWQKSHYSMELFESVHVVGILSLFQAPRVKAFLPLMLAQSHLRQGRMQSDGIDLIALDDAQAASEAGSLSASDTLR